MYYKVFTTEANLIKTFDGVEYREIWKTVVDYEGLYEVSSFGRIKSLRDGGKIMKQYINEKGYLTIGFQSINGSRKKFKSHRVVALSFNPNPDNKPEVNHDDFDKLNNFYLNLLWATGKENTEHAIKGGRRPIKDPSKQKEKVGEYPIRCQKIINAETNTIYDSVYHLSRNTGMAPKEIRRRLSGERLNNTPYLWLKGQYTLVYIKREQRAMERYLELRPVIYGCAI